ncbi:unnamed protein product [Rhizoctonia solani]|nr:unnamed protein product [Rhizoctonia solani]
MAYEKPPEPGTYYIKSVAAPKNVIEILSYNKERAVCSPQNAEKNPNQQWYIQHSGRGYKIKNVKHGLYLTPHSAQPTYGTAIGTSSIHGPVDWVFMRTHDGFAIQYGEEEKAIDLFYGLDNAENSMHLLDIVPQYHNRRWKLERIGDGVGGEVAETVEDRIITLSEQLQKQNIEIAKKNAEIAAKDRLLARKLQEEQKLRDAFNKLSYSGTLSKTIQAQLAEVRERIEGLESLVESYANYPELPNDTS